MAQALRLAERGLYRTQPNPRVGCVIVNQGVVVGQGYHQRAGGPHAEIHALMEAGDRAAGADVYVTLEPCAHTGRTPPCVDALIEAGVARVVAAMQDPDTRVAGQGLARLTQAGIATQVGLLEAQARALNIGFLTRCEQGRPWVRIKLAMSLDGRTAMASGESQWISGAAAREDVQRLRAGSCAIMTGIGTVLQDNPSLNLRATAQQLGVEGELIQPHRVVLDPRLQTPTNARLLSLPGRAIIFTASEDASRRAALTDAGAEVHIVETAAAGLNLHSVMAELAALQVNELQIEAGAILCGSLMRDQLVDELIIYMAPHLMGSEARALMHLPGIEHMQARQALKIIDIRALADDWRIQARPVFDLPNTQDIR